MNITGLFCIIVSYFLGAIPFGLLLTRQNGVDIRQQGSGNIGATNVARTRGKKLGFLTLLGDMAKGFLPVWMADLISAHDPLIVTLSGAAAVLGHIYPVYLRFRGGKGVATALGLFLYLSPLALLPALLVFLLTVRFSGYVSAGSLAAAASLPLWMLAFARNGWHIALALGIAALIWLKHRTNISRLIHGTERPWRKNSGRTA